MFSATPTVWGLATNRAVVLRVPKLNYQAWEIGNSRSANGRAAFSAGESADWRTKAVPGRQSEEADV